MSKELLKRVIDKGVEENLNVFFQDVSKYYREWDDDLSEHNSDRFTGFRAIGEINFSPQEKLVVVIANVEGDLAERSGKKAQYEKARKILKQYQRYDAGIFVFSDANETFRLSLVYGTPDAARLVWSNFRRFTYYANPSLTNKTFLDRVGSCTFTNLEVVKDAFSVEKVNKQFYQEIAVFYYRLTGRNDYPKEMTLPSVSVDDSKKYEEFAVRLIGRSVFCWFLKHKKSANGIPLIPTSVLSAAAIRKNTGYYHTILEPLFFEVMNKEFKGRPPVTIPESDKIPFLNSGLFEPHVNDFYEKMANWGLKIPNKWFTDFFSVLERYNFTIDENSMVDADVSVDPEMLGRIFENLLAEVDPTTGETARKATGSYYTPRLIVDYMVEQSLKQYLLTKTGLTEDKIDSLLTYEDQPQDYTPVEKEAVVRALKEINIIDPACGSGAFTMGILHRMLMVLEKIDPQLEIWQNLYLSAYHPVMRRIIEDKLHKGNEQYIRKLTIIQDSIYGVDIQPIAVEIAKLRCFLSLIVDELVLDNEDNRGIEPLPNLEFKFVAANTLIGLPPKAERQGTFGVSGTVQRLKELRESYLRSYGKEKESIQKDFRATQQKLFKENVEWARSDTLVGKLTVWDPFSYESCGWFDPDWMFGIKGGFDIVIANPPYISVEKFARTALQAEWRQKFKTFAARGDIYCFFYEKGLALLRNGGVLAFISSNKFQRAGYGKGLRHLLATQRIHFLIDFCELPVFAVSTDPMIVIVSKSEAPANHEFAVLVVKDEAELSSLPQSIKSRASRYKQKQLKAEGWSLEGGDSLALVEKLRSKGTPLIMFVKGRIYRGIITGLNEAFVIDRFTRDRLIREDRKSAELIKPWIRGKDIKKWTHEFHDLYVIIVRCGFHNELKQYPAILRHLSKFEEKLKSRGQCKTSRRGTNIGQHHWLELDNNPSESYIAAFDEPKIVFNETSRCLHAYLDTEGNAINKTGFIILTPEALFVLAVLNSTPMDWLYRSTFPSWGDPWSSGRIQFRGDRMNKVPIPPASSADKSRLTKLAGRAAEYAAAGDGEGLDKVEQEINDIVYRLFDLNSAEITQIKTALINTHGENSGDDDED